MGSMHVRPQLALAPALVAVFVAASLSAQAPQVVVSNGPGAWGATPRLVQDLRIGVLEGSPQVTFGGVSFAAIGKDGAIVVADTRPNRLLMYDAAGKFVRYVGREGQGPGEFVQIDGLKTTADGTIVVWDGRSGRISLYSPAGDFRTSHSYPNGFFTNDIFNVDVQGNFYIKGRVGVRAPGEFPLQESYQWTKLSPSGVKLDVIPVPMSSAPPRTKIYAGPYAISSVPLIAALSPLGYVVTADPDKYSINLLRPGQPLRIDRTHTPVPLTRGERAEWEKAAEYWSARPIGRSLRMVNGRPDTTLGPTVKYEVPDVKPAIRGIQVDEEGRIWVERFVAARQVQLPATRPTPSPNLPASPPSTWLEDITYDVFEPSGRMLGTLVVPRGVQFLARRGTTIVGRLSGELGEQYVVRYRILPTGR